jgi:WhiB family redox-sensing transcriptional regulator
MSVTDIPDDGRTGWRARAACYGMDTNLFFPEVATRADAAVAVCAACPVAAECLVDNLKELHGVFGGLTPDERIAVRRGRPVRTRRRTGERPDGSLCGTTRGHSRHQSAGEPPCANCKAAKAARRRETRAAKNAQKRAA